MTHFGRKRTCANRRSFVDGTGHVALPDWGIAGVHGGIGYLQTTVICGVRSAAAEGSSEAAMCDLGMIGAWLG
jgi:hypothetical protein